MKTGDRELAKIQSFTLDALAPLTALVEKTEELSAEETRDAALTGIELIGNANARMSRLRREKIVTRVSSHSPRTTRTSPQQPPFSLEAN